jgi:predicted glutamine amidotransferase
MCLILERNPAQGTGPDDATIRAIYRKNPDGFGAMWLENGKVRTWKCVPRDADEAVAVWHYFDGVHVVAHWRMCTHGHVTDDNAHPFDVVEGEIAVVHNGVIPGHGDADTGAAPGESDISSGRCCARRGPLRRTRSTPAHTTRCPRSSADPSSSSRRQRVLRGLTQGSGP